MSPEAAKPGNGPKKSAPPGPAARYFRQTKDLGNAAVMSVPLLFLYSVGLLVTGSEVLNGADFVTNSLYRALGGSGYLILQGALLVVAVGSAIILRNRGRFDLRHYPLVLAESLVYALCMGTIILFVMREARLLGASGEFRGPIQAIVLSAGAGFHEELVFRLFLLGGMALGLKKILPNQPWLGVTIAVVVTSVLFSLAHYVGPPEFTWYTFWYRSFAGIFFAALFVARGFAVAAYTHALYDIYVMLF